MRRTKERSAKRSPLRWFALVSVRVVAAYLLLTIIGGRSHGRRKV